MPRTPQRVRPFAVPMEGDDTMVNMTTADGQQVAIPRAAAERAGVEMRAPQVPMLEAEPAIPPALARTVAPEEGVPPLLARDPGQVVPAAAAPALATAPAVGFETAPTGVDPFGAGDAQRRAAITAQLQQNSGEIPTAGVPEALQRAPAPVSDPFNAQVGLAQQEGEEFVGATAPAAAVAPRARGRGAPATPEQPADPDAELIDALISRPEGGAPIAPQDFRTSSPLERALERNDRMRQRAQEGGESLQAAAIDRERIAAEAEAEQAELAARRTEAMNSATQAYAGAVQEARSAQVNPSRLFQNGGGVAVAIASVLGSLGSALTGGPNTALQTIERAIDRDIRAQTTNQANAQRTAQNVRGFIDITRQRFTDEGAQIQAARSLAMDQVAQRLERQAATLTSAAARDEAGAMADQLRQQSLQAAREAAVAEQTRLLEQRQAVADIRVREAEATRAERRAAGGGGGRRRNGIVPTELIGTPDDPVVSGAVNVLGMDPVLAAEQAANTSGGARSGRNRLLNRIGEAQSRQGRLAQGFQLAPGRTLSERQIQDVNGLVAADREFNAAIQTIQEYGGRLRSGGLLGLAWEQVRGRAGFGSRDFQTVNHAIDVIRTQFRNINQSGNALGAQQQAAHDFPNLTENISLDAILNNVMAARDVKHRYVQAVLSNLGIQASRGADEHAAEGGGAP